MNNLGGIDFQYYGNKGKGEARAEGKVEGGGTRGEAEELWFPRSLEQPGVCLGVCSYSICNAVHIYEKSHTLGSILLP